MDSEIDMNLMRLLNECNLPHLYEFLLKQNIDIETLKMFKPHHASLLFKELPVGDYAKFEFKLEKWKKQFESTDNTQSTTALSSINTTFRDHQKISVMEILSSTSNGKEILNFYGKYDHLQEEQRALLVNTITKYIDLNGIPCSVSDCSEIEQQICTIFPTEQIEYYSTGKRGKIYNKLANYKRAAKNILKPDEPQQKENCIPEPEENYTFDVQCLRSKEISTSDLHHYWKRCAPLRFRQISNSMTTAEVFKLWPEYAEPSGYLLIDMDFVLKVPMATKFNERWPQYSEKLLHLMKSKISCSIVSKKLRQIKEINEESSIFTILWYCHYLFPPQQRTSVDETGAKFRKKFSMVDSQHSFALVAGSSEELEDKLSLLKQQGRSIKPKLLVVGEISNIKSIYVYFDGLRYPFLTVLNAVDTLFKIFFVFNLQFPDESEIFYNFIQIFFYDFPSNTKFVKSSAIKHEILKLT